MVAIIDHRDVPEPSGLGHELLIEWAPWARDDGIRQSWSVKPKVPKGYAGDPPDNYWLVDRVVAPHKRENDSLWAVVSREYLGEMPRWLMERELNKPEWWIKTKLFWACQVVEREYSDLTRLDIAVE